MSDDDIIEFDTVFLSSPPFNFTDIIPLLSKTDDSVLPTSLPETPTDFSTSTPFFLTTFEISPLPTLTQTLTDGFPSSVGTQDTRPLTSGDPTSRPLTLTDISLPATLPTDFSGVLTSTPFHFPSITIDLSTLFSVSISIPTTHSNPLTPTFTPSGDLISTPGFTLDSSLTTDLSFTSIFTFTTFDSSFMTSDFTSTSPSPSLTSPDPILSSSNVFSTTTSGLTSSTIPSSSSSSSRSFPPPVTQTSFPTFGSDAPTQARTSPNRTGMIVAVTTGAIAFAIVVALLAIVCRKRYLKTTRRRATLDPFVDDLDGEMIGVNQPLMVDDGPSPGGAVYSDPFTDDSRPITQSRSLSLATGLGSGPRAESNDSYQAVVGQDSTRAPSPDLTVGQAAQYHNQHQSTNQLSLPSQPPPQPSPSDITRSRSPQTLPPVQTQFSLKSPPHPSSPPFDAGAVAYIRYADQTTGRGPPSPSSQYSAGDAEDLRLTSAFSVASEPSPRYSTRVPPFDIDEMLRTTPDPIKASSSYRPPFDRRQSLTPTVGGPAYEPGDILVIAPRDTPTQSPTNPGSAITLSPSTIRAGNFGSRPSPIPEVVEMPAHSQDGSNDSETWISTRSEDTSRSSPVVMTAERVQLTPMVRSVTSLVSPIYTPSPGPPTSNYYGEFVPPTGATNDFPQLSPALDDSPLLPTLLPVQPLTLGKKRPFQS